jgi:S-DNA-T family DNA segregation ATPase FtsK/SpoIIIE
MMSLKLHNQIKNIDKEIGDDLESLIQAVELSKSVHNLDLHQCCSANCALDLRESWAFDGFDGVSAESWDLPEGSKARTVMVKPDELDSVLATLRDY